MRRPEYKAVIEIWLAARNDAALRAELQPAIARLRTFFEPTRNPSLAAIVGSGAQDAAFYRMAVETLIGMALRRATAPRSALKYERETLDMLASLARQRDRHRSRT